MNGKAKNALISTLENICIKVWKSVNVVSTLINEHAARLDCPFGNQTTAQGGCLVCKNTEYKCVCIVDNREGKQVQRLSYMSVGIEGGEEPRGQRRAESPRSCHRPVNVTMRCSLRGEGGLTPPLLG